MDPLAAALERSPELFPHTYDPDGETVSLVRLTRKEFEEASFLDERVLRPQTISRRIAWDELSSAVEGSKLAERCNYIFHIGHVGSTLLSRLLGAHDHVFALREPAILRTIALNASGTMKTPRRWSEAERERRISMFIKLWSRTFGPQQMALIKATSFVSDMAADLLARPTKPKALFLYVPPQSFMATILAGPNAREEAQAVKGQRLRRLHSGLGQEVWDAAELSEGEALAMSWATEMTALAAAGEGAKERVLWLDFEDFLETPEKNLETGFRHFDLSPARDELAKILSGPLMQRYSKAPEHAYSPALRRQLLDEARATHRGEIDKGLAWLERSSASFPAIRDCLSISNTARAASR